MSKKPCPPRKPATKFAHLRKRMQRVKRPTKSPGKWVFDDDRVGLDKEPFVAGADTMIDMAVRLKGIANAGDGFVLVFSSTPFPSADFQLEWLREEAVGTCIGAVSRSRGKSRNAKVGFVRP